MKKAVIFIIFNRPDTTRIVFEKIKKYKPEQLFIIADGPRKHIDTDEKLCKQTRDIVNVNWKCEVTKLYSDENLGCQRRISSGLDYVFQKVEDAIILEDDCVPHDHFFLYCEELLEKYKTDSRIMAISGNNFQNKNFHIEESYYYSKYNHCWGWATWKRAWNYFDVDMDNWPLVREKKLLSGHFNDVIEEDYWNNIFEKTYQKKIDSWAYAWTFACWVQNGLTILPKINLVSNIGFGEHATHTKYSDKLIENLSVFPLEFPFVHPSLVIKNYEADRYTSDNIYKIGKIRQETSNISIKKVEFYEKLMEKKLDLPMNKNIIIYGTGKMAIYIFDYLISNGVDVTCFIDNFYKKSHFLNRRVYSIENFPISDDQLILFSILGDHDVDLEADLKNKFPKVRTASWKDF
ncbi:hypothetical protein P9858_02475 [Niallia circulans]|uniref:hypothetical protein n=1 Tax=Niallia circulans TaxID=1397 RepID=UPI002E21EDBC|nr:hypothetical protein [Niallia circulans]